MSQGTGSHSGYRRAWRTGQDTLRKVLRKQKSMCPVCTKRLTYGKAKLVAGDQFAIHVTCKI